MNQWKMEKSQTLIKYFNGTTTSVSNVLLSSGILSIIFVLCSKGLLVIVSFVFILLLLAVSISFASSFI